MANSAARTVANATAHIGGTWPYRMCLSFVRTMIGVPGVAPTAYAAWLASYGKHYGDRNPPAGAPVFWGGGSGHTAVSLGGGVIVSTDWPTAGRVGRTTIETLTNTWHKPYLGWTDTLNGVRLNLGATTAPGNASNVINVIPPIPIIPHLGSNGAPLPNVLKYPEDAASAAKNTYNALKALSSFFALLSSPAGWLRLIMFGAGMWLLIIGVASMVRNESIANTARAGLRASTKAVTNNAS